MSTFLKKVQKWPVLAGAPKTPKIGVFGVFRDFGVLPKSVMSTPSLRTHFLQKRDFFQNEHFFEKSAKTSFFKMCTFWGHGVGSYLWRGVMDTPKMTGFWPFLSSIWVVREVLGESGTEKALSIEVLIISDLVVIKRVSKYV